MQTPLPTEKFPQLSEIMQKALENRYDIQIAKQEIDVAEKNLTVVARQKFRILQSMVVMHTNRLPIQMTEDLTVELIWEQAS